MNPSLVVVGDALLDRDVQGRVSRICPDSPCPVLEECDAVSRPGGAALAAALAAGVGRGVDVRLVTPLPHDEAGAEIVALLEAAGVEVIRLPCGGATGEKIRLRCGEHTLLRLDRGGNSTAPSQDLKGEAIAALRSGSAILVADYGRGTTNSAALRRVLAHCGPLVWDPHPRGEDPLPGCQLVTPNGAELQARWPAPPQLAPGSVAALAASSEDALRGWGAAAIAVTRGSSGVLLARPASAPLAIPVQAAQDRDACGAGDCFSASAAWRLASGALPSEAVTAAAQDASRFVAAGGAASWRHRAVVRPDRPADALRLVSAVRGWGGTVVAAGGCFDILHAGHVALLEAARSLGDCLVVCMNSDRSVRRLKGTGRPVNPAEDRAATLLALGSVDAVQIFDDDTPEAVLRLLRPDVWAKGGDYQVEMLPEAAVLGEWGGQAVVLPYLAGRSTTGILARARPPGCGPRR